MSWSFKLLTVRGIPIRVHASFLLILAWSVYIGLTGSRTSWQRSVGFMVLFTVLLFVCVVLHELGHSLVAQLFGVKVHDITLWPIGGVARIAGMPERPHQEFLITAAGPATNVLLALLLGGLALAWVGPDEMLRLASSPWRLERLVSNMNGQSLVLLLAANNLFLALFNLIPAFPMDGGRLLRSLLAAFLPFRQATRVASLVGQAMAAVMGMIALLTGSFTLGLVALFVFMSAWQERSQAVTNAGLAGLRVRQAMQPVGVRLHPLQTLGDTLAQVAGLSQSAFLVVDGGRLAGLLTRGDLLALVRKAGPEARLGQFVTRDYLKLAPDDTLLAAQERMQMQAAAAVVEEGRVIGILTRSDLARVAEIMEAHPGALSRG